MKKFGRAFRRKKPFLASVINAFIAVVVFVILMLINMPAVMDMDGHLHIIATVAMSPYVFVFSLFVSYLYLKIRSVKKSKDEQI